MVVHSLNVFSIGETCSTLYSRLNYTSSLSQLMLFYCCYHRIDKLSPLGSADGPFHKENVLI
jgi:hypothetical protein